MLITVLEALNLPVEILVNKGDNLPRSLSCNVNGYIASYFFLYRDRLRTMINVFGDAVGTGIVQHLSKADLMKQDHQDTNDKNHITTSM